jgi:broad specificity phosphatase PhoE
VPVITRFLLVRHGATGATEEDRFSGSSDAELSEHGRWQARVRVEQPASSEHPTKATTPAAVAAFR